MSGTRLDPFENTSKEANLKQLNTEIHANFLCSSQQTIVSLSLIRALISCLA